MQSAYSKTYSTFSGADIVATITLPGGKPVVLGEIQTISYSIHRDKFPARTLGRINPKGYCLPESERVYVREKGYVSIKDVEVGDSIQIDVHGFGSVVNKYDNGIKPCYRLELENGYHLTASYDHRIMTQNGWKEMQDINIGDRIYVCTSTPSPDDAPLSDDMLLTVAGFINPENECEHIPQELLRNLSKRQVEVFLNGLLHTVPYCTKSKRLAEDIRFLLSKISMECKIEGECSITDIKPPADTFRVVTGIAPAGEQRVYDITVDNVHSFICNHILVHNSYGGRTIGGSLIFTVFNKNVLKSVIEEAFSSNALGQLDFSKFNNNEEEYLINEMYYRMLADEMPPFDVTITFANEYGNTAQLTISGVTIIDEGQVMSIEDMVTENTMSYQALDITPMLELGQLSFSENNGLYMTKFTPYIPFDMKD